MHRSSFIVALILTFCTIGASKRLYTNACEKMKQFPGNFGNFGGYTALFSTGNSSNVNADSSIKYSGFGSTVFGQSGCGPGGVNGQGWCYQDINNAVGATYTRAKWRFQGFPNPTALFCSDLVTPFMIVKNGSDSLAVRIDSVGKVNLFLNGTNQLARTASALSANTWYIFQLKVDFKTVGASYSLRISLPNGGASQTLTDTSAANATAVPTRWEFGFMGSAASNNSFWMDDLAVNDAQGSYENSYPSDSGKVIYSLPAADSARGGWTGGGRGTTNLYKGVNWNPYSEFFCTISQDTATILNQQVSSTDNVFLYCQDYTTAGIAASSQILLVQAEVMAGDSLGGSLAGGTNKQGALLISSNPAQLAESLFTYSEGLRIRSASECNGGQLDNQWGWAYERTAPVYLPAVNRSTQPVMMIGRRTAVTGNLFIFQAELIVEYSLLSSAQDAQLINY